ncbi:hypothetical protein BKA70DRAFT_1263825 [Coprinopsis sp. MPI-PUGE-AT-0042]|nr:hypothetical protein BKA70DRAFT_1263825 [Coprinopsis sp. MPI-PUGE-AT-0042]
MAETYHRPVGRYSKLVPSILLTEITGPTQGSDASGRQGAKIIVKRFVILLGSLHLTLMSGLGIWLWRNLIAFGTREIKTANECASSFASTHCGSALYSSTRCSSFQGSISCFLSLSSSSSLLSTSFSLLTLKLLCDRIKESRAERKKGNGDLVRSWPSCYFSSP